MEVPRSVYETGGKKYLTYMSSRTSYVPGTQPTYQSTVIGNTVPTRPVGGTPGYSIDLNCKTTFVIANSVITSWSYEGNHCVSNVNLILTVPSSFSIRCQWPG